jgi:hypothetical protein
MADMSVPPQDGPHELLSATRRLTRQVRQAQRGTWFPLLLFAGLTLASIPIIRYNRHPLDCRVLHPSGRICIAFAPWSYVYWPLALVLAYAAIAAFYVHRAHGRGVGTRVRPYVITGVIIAIVATGVSLWRVTHPGGVVGYALVPPSPATEVLFRLASPQGAIGLALLVLAWVERNRALLVFGLVYLVIVGFGWILIPHSPWLFLVTTAAVLLLGSIGFALAERRAGRPAA